jgi:DNA-binding NtrC family response regulator
MSEGFSPASSSARCPRILIADKNFSTLESLTNTLADRRLDVDFHLCTSHNSAALKLLRSSYELIISAAHMAESDDFYLLRQIHSLRPHSPLLVTASTSDKEVARRVLLQGAFDVLPTPLHHEQTVTTIRLGLWHNQLMTLISCKEKAVEKYRQHLLAYPYKQEMDTVFQKTLSAIENSIAAFRLAGLKAEGFADLATTVKQQARERALRRLDTLLHNSTS